VVVVILAAAIWAMVTLPSAILAVPSTMTVSEVLTSAEWVVALEAITDSQVISVTEVMASVSVVAALVITEVINRGRQGMVELDHDLLELSNLAMLLRVCPVMSANGHVADSVLH
jgi:hypothetical protein